MDAHFSADRETAIRLKFLQVQAGTQRLDLKIGQPCGFTPRADKRENSGHVQDSHAFTSWDVHKQVPGKQWKLNLRLAAIFPAAKAPEQWKKTFYTAVFQMLANPLLMSRTGIDGVPMGRALGSRKWRRWQQVRISRSAGVDRFRQGFAPVA